MLAMHAANLTFACKAARASRLHRCTLQKTVKPPI